MYNVVRIVYNYPMTTTNAHAVKLIDDMIANTTSEINLVNGMLSDALAELQSRAGQAQMELEQALNITEHGLTAAATKAEQLVVRRAELYKSLRTLEFVVRPAAFG